MNPQPGSTPDNLRRVWLGAVLWVCLFVLCLGRAGCSIEKNYSTLSIFFDGVPNPEAMAKAAAAGGITGAMRQSATYSVHRPFADERCAECHSASFELSGQDSSICLKCHADQTTKHERMHGPVVAVACLWCHSPHESAEPFLLKKPARQVCSQCHEPQLLNVDRTPEHADASRSCLECHMGHGGAAQYFLRDGVSREPPRGDAQGPAPK